MKKHAILLLFVLLLASGCASSKSWVYSANNYGEPLNSISKSVAVLPFQDARPNINKDKTLMYMIPLMPYGSQNLEVPEGLQRHVFSAAWTGYKPTEDYPKALAEEINNSKLFKEAYFDYKTGSSDYVVRGKILTTKYRGKILSYGLSVYGPLLWYIGLPAGTVTNELSVELSLVDAKTEDVLFSNTYTSPEYGKVGWMYAMPIDFNYPTMLKGLYKEFIEDVRTRTPEFSTKLSESVM